MRNMRKFCSAAINKTYFVTTPIYYVNAAPHIGHLYSSVIADAVQRWHKLLNLNEPVLFSTGTDEHGMKVQQAAASNKITVNNYCKNISEKYKFLTDTFHIDYTNFIRTSDAAHKTAVHHFWNTLKKNGHIYSARYSGWYCVSDETFLSESQLTEKLLPSGEKARVSAESGHPVEWTEEENYMFRLSSFQADLKHWLRGNESAVKPPKFYQILCNLIESDALNDVSISRPVSRVFWGIPVPDDSEHTVYVWMDALINYLTVAGYPNTESPEFKRNWPPDFQVIGKDILKFHGVYWPAFLMAAGLEPPKTLFCHSHWTIEGQKMSKSKNNVICPLEKMKAYTSDGLRYFLLREGVAHSDGNYSDVKVMRILNAELADTLGNLLSRCCGKALNAHQQIPKLNPEVFQKISNENTAKNLLASLKNLPETVYSHYENSNFYKVVDSVISTLHAANLFFETMKPWELKKSPSSIDELNVVIHVTMETLRIAAIILQPIIPVLTAALLSKLNVASSERYWRNIRPYSWENLDGFQVKCLSDQKAVLFRRILAEGDKKMKKIQ